MLIATIESFLYSPLLLLCMVSSLVRAGVLIQPNLTNAQAYLIQNVTFYSPGQTLDLYCTTDRVLGDIRLNWTFPNHEDSPAISMQNNRGTLHLPKLKGKDGGKYTCTDGMSVASYYVNVLDKDSLVAKDEITLGTVGHVVLRCNQTFERAFPLRWRYENLDMDLNDVPKENHTYLVKAEDHWNLHIYNADRYPDKSGKYTCELDLPGANIPQVHIWKSLYYYATPDVRIKEGSVSATKGEDQELTCIFYGDKVHSFVIWNVTNNDGNHTLFTRNDARKPCPYKGKEYLCNDNILGAMTTTDDVYEATEEARERGEKTSVLILKNVTDRHRGTYRCYAINQHGENHAEVFLRAKDKLAALWPFLGILAEILILALFIFACERKRSKEKEAEEEALMSDHAGERDRADQTDANLRNRK